VATPLPPESERFEPGSLADWHDWLAEHHADATGIWLVTPRRRPPENDLTYDECVREALCWGWIDGQVKALDETRNLQRWTPRSSRSGWSRTNQVRIAELEPTGRIQPAGRAVIEAAKVSGMWNLFDDAENRSTRCRRLARRGTASRPAPASRVSPRSPWRSRRAPRPSGSR
jgi:uncharacterized protein YdeI (YjbR/CyaY-like superfamily)